MVVAPDCRTPGVHAGWSPSAAGLVPVPFAGPFAAEVLGAVQVAGGRSGIGADQVAVAAAPLRTTGRVIVGA